MSEATFDQEGGGFTFTDEDFERRYYSPQQNISRSGTGGAGGGFNPHDLPNTAQTRRSPNRFMRTLLRRRLAAAARSA
jgi:hypothetical protein